jgi:hypothetical protein
MQPISYARHRFPAQLVMVVEILVSQGQSERPLAD